MKSRRTVGGEREKNGERGYGVVGGKELNLGKIAVGRSVNRTVSMLSIYKMLVCM